MEKPPNWSNHFIISYDMPIRYEDQVLSMVINYHDPTRLQVIEIQLVVHEWTKISNFKDLSKIRHAKTGIMMSILLP